MKLGTMRKKISRKYRKKISAGSKEKRKRALSYHENLMVIKRIQELKLQLANKYLGPYKIIKILRNNRYVVRKMSDHDMILSHASLCTYTWHETSFLMYMCSICNMLYA
jgi:hypothetical protein